MSEASCKSQKIFALSKPLEKIEALAGALRSARSGAGEAIPQLPARDIQVLPIRELPAKDGLSKISGQARLLHDLANIELQAMELAYRTCVEFYNEETAFLDELEALALEEGEHLKLCIEGLDKLGFPWGTWPIHVSLWNAVRSEDSILDRLLIVHRYQEGGGLDAGESLMRRLNGISSPVVKPILDRIFKDELGHVQFGSRWYRKFCQRSGIDPNADFRARLGRLMVRMPRRLERISYSLRQKAGFSVEELEAIEFYQKSVIEQNRITLKPEV